MKLTSSDLHIWHISLGRESLFDQKFSPLPSRQENKHAARLTHPELHQRYLKTRWTMRDILGHYLKASSEQVQLQYAELGKPELIPGAHSLDIRFNLTHSGDDALFAVTLGTDVGIDMEKLVKKPRPIRLAKRYFTKEVVDELAKLTEQNQQTALLKLWTQYEAFKKAQGVGLRGGEGLLPLNFNLPANEFQPLHTGDNKISGWLVSQLSPTHDYIGAVVINSNKGLIQTDHIDYDTYDFS